MTDALLHDIRRPERAADHLVVAGDLTDRDTAEQVTGIRARLDGWGRYGNDYLVCRGNHDVARQYSGLHPDHALGTLADRNHQVVRDFSGLTAAR
ncbi:metallophosphoesterase [Nocardia rhizosphaerae]|uniref:Metallophosphoesterase n=1 Tax=Nocardia rhizosphaerae TaxID=1691571 RepID=A0ABV8L972_9NOCA